MKTNKVQASLTIFYDGQCPLCNLEMDKLKQCDKENYIAFEDIHQPRFEEKFPNINKQKALNMLHGVYQHKVIRGIEVTYIAWTLVGKRWLVFPLNVPIVKQCAQLLYLCFAHFRHPIANFAYRWLGIGKVTCDKGTCYDKTTYLINRRK